jgi:hypothetical protein
VQAVDLGLRSSGTLLGHASCIIALGGGNAIALGG